MRQDYFDWFNWEEVLANALPFAIAILLCVWVSAVFVSIHRSRPETRHSKDIARMEKAGMAPRKVSTGTLLQDVRIRPLGSAGWFLIEGPAPAGEGDGVFTARAEEVPGKALGRPNKDAWSVLVVREGEDLVIIAAFPGTGEYAPHQTKGEQHEQDE